MSLMSTIIVIAITITCATTPSCKHFLPPRVTDATMAQDTYFNRTPIGPTDTFMASGSEIHCLVKVVDALQDTKVKVRWTAVNVEGHPANEPIFEAIGDRNGFIGPLASKAAFGLGTSLDGSVGYYDFTLKPFDKEFPRGEYRADIFVDPDSTIPDHPARRLPFFLH